MGLLLMELEMFILEEKKKKGLSGTSYSIQIWEWLSCINTSVALETNKFGAHSHKIYISQQLEQFSFLCTPHQLQVESFTPTITFSSLMNLQRRHYHPHLEVRTQDPEKVNNLSEASLQMASVNIRTQVSVQLPLFCAALQN